MLYCFIAIIVFMSMYAAYQLGVFRGRGVGIVMERERIVAMIMKAWPHVDIDDLLKQLVKDAKREMLVFQQKHPR